MPDVTSEASLRFTSTGADKAAADARKLEDSLKSVQRQAQRTAASLKSPLGIPAAGGTGARPVSRLAAGRAQHPKAAALGDKIGQAFGNALANTIIAAFTKKTAGIGDGLGKQQEAAGRAVVAQAEATTKAVEAEAKATTKAAEAGLKSASKAGEAKAKSTAKTAEDETKATTKAAQTQLKTTVTASEAKTKATVRSGDAELKAAVLAGEAKAKAAAKAADAEAKAALKSSKAAEARKQAVATSLRTAGQIIAPITGLIPPVLTGIAAAGSGLGLLGAAAIAVAAPVTLLIKSFGWISDAAEQASKNFLAAQDIMRGGGGVAAEQERQQRALTALNVTIGDSAGKFIEQFNKLAMGLRDNKFSDAAQKQLDKFGITKDKLKAFEDKTGNIDPFKALGKFVETQDEIKDAVAAAEKTGDPKAIEKAKVAWDEWKKTLEQIGHDFANAVKGASKETLAAGKKHQEDLDAAMPLGSRGDTSDNSDKFGIAINRMKDTWNRLFQVVGEGAMPAATAAVDKWADVLKAVAPKLAEIGKNLTKEAWSGLGELADYLKQTIDDPDVKAALSYLKGEWLAFWNTLKGVGREVGALVGTSDEVKEAVKGFFKEGKTIWETTKQEFETIKGLVATIGDMGQNTKREWEALKPVVIAVGGVLKTAWDDFVADAKKQWPEIKELAAGVWRAITEGWNTFEGAVRTGFQTLKDFIVGLFKGESILKPGQVPPSMMPGYQPTSYGGDGSDINLDNARFQLANFGTGTAGAEMRGNIDRALIHVSGTMQAVIQNASIMGRTGLDTGPAGVQNASWGGAGTGGFGGGVGGVGRDRGGFESNPAAGASSAGAGAVTGGALGGGKRLSWEGANKQGFFNPVQGGNVISEHGASREGGIRTHKGIDINAPTGTPIRATTDQTITQVGRIGTKYGFGVKALDAQGREHVYAHMVNDPSDLGLQVGSQLKAGQTIGGVGQTGNARTTPPHLHYEVRPKQGAYNESYNPRQFLGASMGGPGTAASAGGASPESTTTPVSSTPLAAPNPSATTAGLRNFNLGNLIYSKQSASRYPGVAGPSINTDNAGRDRQIVFRSMDEGIRAAGLLAERRFAEGRNTVNKLVAEEGGHTPHNYSAAANIARTMGVGPNDPINMRDPATKSRYLRAIATQEHGAAGAAFSAERIEQALNPRGGPSIKQPDAARAKPEGGAAITRPDVAKNQPIIVPPRAAGNGIDKSTVAAQGPAAEGAAARTFKSASEGAAFGQSAAENIRKGLEGTNIPVSGVPSTSRGVSPNTGPKSTGGDAPTSDV